MAAHFREMHSTKRAVAKSVDLTAKVCSSAPVVAWARVECDTGGHMTGRFRDFATAVPHEMDILTPNRSVLHFSR